MASNNSIPGSYDEIVRSTVPDLDSSTRPSKDQEQQAREGFRQMDDAERIIYARVSDALLLARFPLGTIQIEVDREHVILRGTVPDVAEITRAEEIIDEVVGVKGLDNKLVVAAR